MGSSPIGPAIREQGISVQTLKSLFSFLVPLWVGCFDVLFKVENKRQGYPVTGGLELFLEVGIGLGLLAVACVDVIGARRHERIEAMRGTWGGACQIPIVIA
ncbi:MAG: hypothetical protein CVU60_12350 [Deltaproteobacteria bacterium HGW-Deltaproteobacteria-18]|nr:MAG: hypothetical protein CVU60_12350 [Deltaproteobacteria bacterium HGW-Deltaproteobacteria-18]